MWKRKMKRESRKLNSASISTSGGNETQENANNVQNYYGKLVFTKFLCETDVGDSFSVSIRKEDAKDHLPRLAPGKSKMLEFEDTGGNQFRMEFVHTNLGNYYLRIGWERYRKEHKLEYDDLLSVYKKEKENGIDDQQCFYVIESRKLTPDDLGLVVMQEFEHPTEHCLTDVELVLAQLLAVLEDPKSSVEKEPALAKSLRYQDLYGNSDGLKLPKKEVENNLNDRPLARVGGKIILPLFDPTEQKVFQMELIYTNEEKYRIGFGWKEYAVEHKLLTFDTIFVNKIIVNRDEVNHQSAECIWCKNIDDQLVDNSYYYEITFQKRSELFKKAEQLRRRENSSPPASTTTAAATDLCKDAAIPQSNREYDSDDEYWLTY